MQLNPNGNNPSQKGFGGLGAAGAAAFGTRVPFAPHKAPKMMPPENNPFKNVFRDSLSKMSPEAAREILMQRRESLGGILGGIIARGGK